MCHTIHAGHPEATATDPALPVDEAPEGPEARVEPAPAQPPAATTRVEDDEARDAADSGLDNPIPEVPGVVPTAPPASSTRAPSPLRSDAATTATSSDRQSAERKPAQADDPDPRSTLNHVWSPGGQVAWRANHFIRSI